MPRNSLNTLAAGVVALVATQQTHADEVFSTVRSRPGIFTSAIRSQSHVSGFFEAGTVFQVPSNASYALTAIDVEVGSSNTTTATIHLWQNTSGAPGLEIASIPLTGIGTTISMTTATPAAPSITLQAGASYWITITVADTSSTGGPTTTIVPHDVMWRHAPVSGTVVSRSIPSTGLWNVGSIVEVPTLRIHGTPIEVIGGCCNHQTGACFIMSLAACQSFGGGYIGQVAVCGPLSCPVQAPTGACCIGLSCVITTVGGCPGRSEGEGTVCQPIAGVNRCCRADFNASGSVSVQDLFDFLNVYFSGCP